MKKRYLLSLLNFYIILFTIYLLLGFLELSLDNNPNIAVVIKKKAVVYTSNFNANIMWFI